MAKKKNEKPQKPRGRKHKSNFTVFLVHYEPSDDINEVSTHRLEELSDGHEDSKAALKWLSENSDKFDESAVFQVGNMQPEIKLEVKVTRRMVVSDYTPGPVAPPATDAPEA